MRRLLQLVMLLLIPAISSAQVGINTATPDPAAMLEIESVDRGFLMPRLTTASRTAMADVQGMMVYDSDLNQFFYNDGGQWILFLTAGSTTQAGTFDLGATDPGMGNNWKYYNVTFPTAFTTIPAITISLREGTGIDNSGSDTIIQIKVANAATTGFTIGIRETANTTDHFIDWIAVPKS